MHRSLITLHILVFFASVGLAEDSINMTAEEYYDDFKLFKALTSNVVVSLDAQFKCDKSSDDILLSAKNKVLAGFTSAKVAWLQNRPTKAINLLENLIQEHGKANSGQEFVPTVAIAGNYWIATIARHYGDGPRAQKAYADVLKDVLEDKKVSTLSVYCYLYEAEMESTLFMRKDLALEALEKIKKMPPLTQKSDEGWEIFQEWADYQIATLKNGVAEARSQIKGRAIKSEMVPIIADAQLAISGVRGRTGCDVFIDRQHIDVRLEALQSVLEIRTSPIDQSLAQVLLGAKFAKKDAMKAEKYYGALFASDSFFAPEGGIFLAQCQRKQGKVDEANKTFAKVKQIFPGYQKLVDELTK